MKPTGYNAVAYTETGCRVLGGYVKATSPKAAAQAMAARIRRKCVERVVERTVTVVIRDTLANTEVGRFDFTEV